MKEDDTQAFHLHIPAVLHARAKRVAKRIRSSITALSCEGLREKVEHYESRFRVEDERNRAEKEAKRSINGRTMAVLGKSPLAPITHAPAPVPAAIPHHLDPIYHTHAEIIAGAVRRNSPSEKQLRLLEAIAAVKHEAPLTHPPDDDIVAALEARVVEILRNQSLTEMTTAPVIVTPLAQTPPTPRSFTNRLADALMGREVDPSKIRTVGDDIDDE